jgi:hypothetical protein
MRFYLCFLGVFLSLGLQGQGVNIGSGNPADPAAVLELESTQAGFLLPRLSISERNGIANPPAGLMIYNKQWNCLDMYFPSGWRSIFCDCQGPPPAPISLVGPIQACPGDTQLLFVANSNLNAPYFLWSLQVGDSIVSGQGEDSLWVNLGANSGVRNIQVALQNGCGTSIPIGLNVQATWPDTAVGIVPASPLVNSPVVFNSAQGQGQYAWTFSGGNPASSTNQQQQVVFSQSGWASYQLIVSNSQGCSRTVLDSVFVALAPQVQAFSHTGNTQTFVVPAGTNQIRFKGWGAGGGGSITTNDNVGGGGAFVDAFVQVTPLETLTVVVGGGGLGIAPYSGGYGGGGNSNVNPSTNYSPGGGGGGRSALLRGNTLLLVAAGGGGSGGEDNPGTTFGGAGGVNQGFAGGNNLGGGGATQNNGGAAGAGSGSTAGTLGQGGQGGQRGVNEGCGGGGGGGYYGGGGGGAGASGGGQAGGGGGGGSSYAAGPGVSGASLQSGNGQQPGGLADPDRQGAGEGGNGGVPSQSGAHGRVVLIW